MINVQVQDLGPYKLAGGQTLPRLKVAYRSMGTLNAAGTNGVLVLHGYTTGPSMLDAGSNVAEGSWSELVGPGRPIDTDKYFVICPNMLGSCYGSTGPKAGEDFPAITVVDIVNSQKALLDALGVSRLAAVAGPSFGAYQSFQWAVSYPAMVERVIAAVGAPFHPAPSGAARAIQAGLTADPGWPAWRAGEVNAMRPCLTDMRIDTLTKYGVDAELAPRIPDANVRAAEVARLAREWADEFNPMSLVVLMQAAESFDLRTQLAGIKAPVLYVLSRTDPVFSPELASVVLALPGAQHWTYKELDSEKGHFASGADATLWADDLRRFMNQESAA
jgi:homoserine O-acetyltransferase